MTRMRKRLRALIWRQKGKEEEEGEAAVVPLSPFVAVPLPLLVAVPLSPLLMDLSLNTGFM